MWIKILWFKFKIWRLKRRNERLMRKWVKLHDEMHEMAERQKDCPYFNKNKDLYEKDCSQMA